MTKTFNLKDVQPNPFRDFEFNPLDMEHVAALKDSYDRVGDFGTLKVRVRDGKPQLHCGHHRLEALKQRQKEYDFDVEDVTDEVMLQRMVEENAEVNNNNLRRILEVIQGAVKAYAKGTITLDGDINCARPGTLRLAPSYLFDTRKFTDLKPEEQAVAYTPKAIASLLGSDMIKKSNGKPTDEFLGGLNALTLTERKLLSKGQLLKEYKTPLGPKIVYDLTRTALNSLNKGTEEGEVKSTVQDCFQRFIEEPDVAKNKVIQEEFGLPTGTLSKVKKGNKRKASPSKNKDVPDINDFAVNIAMKVNKILTEEGDSELFEEFKELLAANVHLAGGRRSIVVSLEKLSNRALTYHTRLNISQKLLKGEKQ
jgi:hypothetical protein